MNYVLTLIGAALDEALAGKIAAKIRTEQAIGEIDWLADMACDIPLSAGINRADIMRLLADAPIDFAMQPVKTRRKMLIAADMDSTIIKEETIDILADYAGCQNKVADITQRAMRGEIDFAKALIERVALLAGLPESILAQIPNKDITLRKDAQTLSATMRAHQAECLLLSGGFERIVSAIAEQAGFICGKCNQLDIKKGILTGKLIPPIRDAMAKKTELLQQAKKMNLGIENTMAIGDGSNDRFMLEAAGLGIAFHAKPVLEKNADICIRHNDLTALLYIQGIRREDFVKAHN